MAMAFVIFFFFFLSITVLALVLPGFALFQLDLVDSSTATSTTQFRLGLSSPAASALVPQQIMSGASIMTIRSRKVAEVAMAPSSVDSDISALLAFKASVSVDPLRVLSSWGRTNLPSPCGWEGVRCHRDGLRVSALDLPNRYLSGSISPQLGFLSYLVYLDLSGNNFSGTIPPQLSFLASTLIHLDLQQNSLSGPIPVELGLCKELIGLNLSYNPIASSIPASFGNLTSLRTLQLHNMPNLTGSIPPELGSLGNLTYLNLTENSLVGEIPPELGNLEKLEVINLSLNNLTGPIPPQLGRLRNLRTFSVYRNKFLTGTIPPELGKLSNLTGFYAFECNLSGPLPPHLGDLTNLEYLFLSQNMITGSIPPEFGGLKNLQELNSFNNRLSGPLPPQLGQLKKLKSIYLFGNKLLSGPIPPEFGQMESLQILSIFQNSINGSLPAELGRLQNLTEFYAFSNEFTGPIPPELGQMKSLSKVNLGHNHLTGSIPPELGMLKNLQNLEISNSTLSGEIPSTLANLTKLRLIDLSFNSITGDLPDFLANFTHLEWIKISDNLLSGNVGTKLSSLSKLQFVSLSNNSLTGSIPVSFANHSSLVALDLSRNRFTGFLPDSLGLCKNLKLLLVGHNKLGGPLPSWLWSLGRLQVLDLSDNDFTGSIPNSLDKLHGLQALEEQTDDLKTARIIINSKGTEREYFNVPSHTTSMDLSVNRIGGNLPETLGLLKVLSILNVSWNLFSGAIPGSMANMSALESLDLSHNKLSDVIPSNFSQLSTLSNVDFSSNNLSGPIPQGGQFSTFESQRFLDNPYLCGVPLNKSCSDGRPNTETGPSFPRKGLSNNSKAVIAVSFSVFIITLGVMAFLCFRQRKHEQKQQQNEHEQPLFGNELNVTVQDLIIATGGYNDNNIIGKGGFSTVYKAILTDGTVVAVKKLHTLNEGEAWRSLVAECKTLGKIRHRNLLKILCTCVTPRLKAIVLEYMPNGSLQAIMYDCKVCVLNWEARFKIACGIAQGLDYLHYDSGFGQVLHLDLKPGNILLDKDFEPRISDFGISRLVNPDKDGATLASAFAGSIGYMPPEMGYSDRVTSKADVYSYGVIILELITRKKPTDTPPGRTDYPGWIRSFLPDKTREVIDPQLLHDADAEVTEEGKYKQICLLLKLGLMCAQVLPANRPTMRDVVKELISIASNYGYTHQYLASYAGDVFKSDEATSGKEFLIRMMEMSSASTSLFTSSDQQISAQKSLSESEI